MKKAEWKTLQKKYWEYSCYKE